MQPLALFHGEEGQGDVEVAASSCVVPMKAADEVEDGAADAKAAAGEVAVGDAELSWLVAEQGCALARAA